MAPEWVNPMFAKTIEEYGDIYKNNTPPNQGVPMQSEGTRITQQPELYLAADVEPYAKGGWKTVVKASIRVFDGDAAAMYIQLESMVQSGLAIAHNAITAHEDQIKPAPPFMEEATNEHV